MKEFRRVLGDDIDKIEIDLEGVTKFNFDIFWNVKLEDQPLLPATAAILKERDKSPGPTPNPCLPGGVPGSLLADVTRMIQTPREIVVLDEGDPASIQTQDGFEPGSGQRCIGIRMHGE